MPSSPDNKLPTQITIEKAILKKMDSDVTFDLLLEDNGTPAFRGVSFNESIFAPSVEGKIFIEDKNSFGEIFNITGYEILEMTIKSFDDEHTQEIKFHVGEVSEISDSASTTIDGVGGPSTVYTIELHPFEVEFFNTEEPVPEGSAFIGKIADGAGNGLVNNLALRYFSPESTEFSSASKEMDIEPTFNSIWNKTEQAGYPYGKFSAKPHLMQYMNYLAENSVSEDNASAANYLFWQDLDQWHFRSIDSLIRNGTVKPYKVDPTSFSDKDTITSFTFSKKINQKELLNSPAFKSFYTHVCPAYYDSYANYMTTKDKLIRSSVSYDYFDDYDKWSHLEGYQLLPDKLNNDNSTGVSVFDSFYGFFNINEYNDPSPTKLDYSTSTTDKNTTHSWQTMFDQTDLSIDPLKIIKSDVFSADNLDLINQYASKRLLKEKWNVYKYSICCEDQPTPDEKEQVGLGMIVGYDTFNNNESYRYRVAPVEIWNHGASADPSRILNSETYLDDNFLVVAQSITGPDSRIQTVDAYNVTEIFNGPRGKSHGIKQREFSEKYYLNSSVIPEPVECQSGELDEVNLSEMFSTDCICASAGCLSWDNNKDGCRPEEGDGQCALRPGCQSFGDCSNLRLPSCARCQGNGWEDGGGCLNMQGDCWTDPSACDEGCVGCDGTNQGSCCGCAAMPEPDVLVCRVNPDDPDGVGLCGIEPICNCCCDPDCNIVRFIQDGDPGCEDDTCGVPSLGVCCPTEETYNDGSHTECIPDVSSSACADLEGEWLENGFCNDCSFTIPDPPIFGCCKCTSFGLPNCRTYFESDIPDGGEDWNELIEDCLDEDQPGGPGVIIETNPDDPDADPCDECTEETAPCPEEDDEECCFEGFGGLTFDYWRQLDRYKEDTVIGPVGSLPSITGGSTFECMKYESITSGGFQFDENGAFDKNSESTSLKGTIVRLFRVEKSNLAHIDPNPADEKEYIYLFESPQPVNQFMIGDHQGISCGIDDPENGEIPVSQCGIKFPPSDELPPLDQGEGGFND